MLKTRPLVHSDSRKSSELHLVQMDVLQILWLLANPLQIHCMAFSFRDAVNYLT